jgi:hypothetical protein
MYVLGKPEGSVSHPQQEISQFLYSGYNTEFSSYDQVVCTHRAELVDTTGSSLLVINCPFYLEVAYKGLCFRNFYNKTRKRAYVRPSSMNENEK